MTTNMNRHPTFLDRLRKAFDRPEIEMLAMKCRGILTPQRAQRFNRLVGARTARMKVESERGELFLEPSTADPEDRAPVRQLVEGRSLLGDIQRMPLRKNQHPGRELDLFSDRGRKRQRQKRIGYRDILAAGNLSARRVWVRRLVVLRYHDVLDRPHRLNSALFRSSR